MPLGHIATLLLGYVSSFLRAVSLVTHVMLSHNVVSHKLAEDARSWLQVHSAMYGEQSPMTGCTFLPWGRRSEYYSMYVFERSSGDLSHLDGQAADQKTFMAAWRNECWNIQIASRTSMFVGCAACKFMQGLISSTPREQDHLLKALRHRLGRHYAFQAAQRLADEKLVETARRSNNLDWQLGFNHNS